MQREKFHWKVELAYSTGTVESSEVSSFWSPEKEGTTEAVGIAAMIQEWVSAGKPTKHANEFCAPVEVVQHV